MVARACSSDVSRALSSFCKRERSAMDVTSATERTRMPTGTQMRRQRAIACTAASDDRSLPRVLAPNRKRAQALTRGGRMGRAPNPCQTLAR